MVGFVFLFLFSNCLHSFHLLRFILGAGFVVALFFLAELLPLPPFSLGPLFFVLFRYLVIRSFFALLPELFVGLVVVVFLLVEFLHLLLGVASNILVIPLVHFVVEVSRVRIAVAVLVPFGP